MRRRLVSTYVLLLALVLLALEVPLAVSLTNRETQQVLADRLADATRFAALAAPALRTGDLAALTGELRRYHELYGIGTLLVDQDQQVLSTIGGPPPGAGATTGAIRGALAGRQVSTPATLWPWRDDPLMVAVPVSDGGAVLGGLVTASPTTRSRDAIVVSWAELGLGGLLAVVACVVAALRLATWVLRPVTRLDAVVHEITAGADDARVVPGAGPPELRRLSASFNEMADAVAEAMERQRSFVAYASHQLRNPLTVVRLRVEDLADRLAGPGAEQDHGYALEEIDRLTGVLDSLLALARAERGRQPIGEADLAAVARDRHAAWQPLAARRGIALVLSADGPAYARGVGLDQVLDALIDNALKFTPAGGRVTITAREGLLEVADTGPGMTAEQCKLATERFWRAPDTQNVDGAGLGLPIVAVLAEASGGRLELVPGPGLVARITL
ncbi:sensor histidine kinase [Actinoplanes sp. RD1]|uniref:sensor histidine kinase n=1 Tax=Actinoplanes sp. RD1 TaxID=3064538 RepID=UPI00274274CA|nr:HAMP domain-containing sensor histidine kinase [Actinoplanes sp. RD1]